MGGHRQGLPKAPRNHRAGNRILSTTEVHQKQPIGPTIPSRINTTLDGDSERRRLHIAGELEGRLG